MTRAASRRIPPVVRRALLSPGGRCYRHCDQPVRTVRLRTPDPGDWTVRACPGGVVSITSYAEWARSDPTEKVARRLRRWVARPALLRRRDLRSASRRGPELGRAAERRLAADPNGRPVRVVYWRVYPFRGRDGAEHRLFVCFANSHAGPVFFTAPVSGAERRCPRCHRTVGPARR